MSSIESTTGYRLWRALRVMPCRCPRHRKDRPAPPDCARCAACKAFERENPECLSTLEIGASAAVQSGYVAVTEAYS